jgi:hypothetical protein
MVLVLECQSGIKEAIEFLGAGSHRAHACWGGTKADAGVVEGNTGEDGTAGVSYLDASFLLVLTIGHFIDLRSSVLSAFEESSAACISDMLRQVSNGQYLDAIRMAEKFILHVEVLFATIDDLEYHFSRLNMKGEYSGNPAVASI